MKIVDVQVVTNEISESYYKLRQELFISKIEAFYAERPKRALFFYDADIGYEYSDILGLPSIDTSFFFTVEVDGQLYCAYTSPELFCRLFRSWMEVHVIEGVQS